MRRKKVALQFIGKIFGIRDLCWKLEKNGREIQKQGMKIWVA
jgi:hypothetical protein